MSKTMNAIRQEILEAISVNVRESQDTDYPEAGSLHAVIARTLAETYKLLDGF